MTELWDWIKENPTGRGWIVGITVGAILILLYDFFTPRRPK